MINEKPRILIIDDEHFYINVLINLLQEKYQVSIAKNGEHGIQRALHIHRPDLILLDIMMPGIDGYETCRRLKEKPETKDIPVIFLTVKSEVDDEVRGFKLGAVDYIIKPISPPIVLSRIKTHLLLAKTKQILIDHKAVEIELEKLKIYKAMLDAANHVLNNFLNNMLLFKITAEASQDFPPSMVKKFDEVIDDTAEQIRALGSIIDVNEKSILKSVLPGYDNN